MVFTDHTIAESACIPSRASIMTGQCGPRAGVTQTDGLFKNGDASNFPWLRADGAPTAGDYFRELGYSTHYFGKWHVSDPLDHTLQGYGFGDMRTCPNLRPVRCCSQGMCALSSGEWKLVRYCDPWSERPAQDQWELYNLDADPIEAINLLVYDGPFPTVIDPTALPTGVLTAQVMDAVNRLRAELARQEIHLLSPYSSLHPSART